MLSDKELQQIREVVDRVVEARLMQSAEIQVAIVSDMLINMSDKYVQALMDLARAMGAPDPAARREAERVAELMLKGL